MRDRRTHKLTPASRDCIDWLAEYGPSTITEYAEDMGLSYSTALKRVHVLERFEAVERTRTPRRQPDVIRLSAFGKAVHAVEIITTPPRPPAPQPQPDPQR